MPAKTNTLPKKEIIKGFRSFENVLTSGKRFEKRFLTAYVEQGVPVLNGAKDNGYVPVKVGFILSKKKLKKHTIGTE